MRSTRHPVCVLAASSCARRCRSRRRAADARQHERRGADADADEASSLGTAAAYPANLTAANLAYFLVVPTLIYQPSYPRSTRFRGRWLFLCAPPLPRPLWALPGKVWGVGSLAFLFIR